MAGESSLFPGVTAVLSGLRRSLRRCEQETIPADQPAEARWRSDLRLFAITFAGGFVFFLSYLG
jgi:hypothetical protein